MSFMKCSAAAMALCPDRDMCCSQENPGVFAVGSECYRFNKEVENQPKNTCALAGGARLPEEQTMDEKKTIPQILEEVLNEICSKYCRFPLEGLDDDQLIEQYCENCPMMRLI